MLEAMAVLALLVGVVIFLMQIMIRWGTTRLTQEVETRMRAAESIVNHNRLPEAWLRRDRERIAAIRRSGKDQEEIDRVGRKAVASSLRQIDGLIKFFETSPVLDSAESRETLLSSLREKRTLWAAERWQNLVDATNP
jgi:hypothetical protein